MVILSANDPSIVEKKRTENRTSALQSSIFAKIALPGLVAAEDRRSKARMCVNS